MNSKLVLVLLAAAGPLGAQAIVRGAVMTEQGQRIAGVELQVPSLRKTVRTDSTGEYRMVLPPGSYRMMTRAMGFFSISDVIEPEDNVELIHDFTLTSLAQILDTVTTTAASTRYLGSGLRGFEERSKIGMGKFLSEEILQRNSNRLLADVLRLLPGIQIRRGRGTANFAASTRGGGCLVTVFLDGMPLNGPRSLAVDLNQFQTGTLAGVEFYGSAATSPVQFKDRTGCGGLLLLWTRER